MIKIISDPTSLPITEVDLTESGTNITFIPNASRSNRDIVNTRPDGGSVVFARKSRNQISVNVLKGLPLAEWQKLQRIMDAGSTVEFAPNWDTNTRFYAPLSESTKALRRSGPNEAFVYDSGTFTTDATAVRYAYNSEQNYLFKQTVNTPTFTQSNFGDGLYICFKSANLMTYSGLGFNGSNTPQWSASSGLPTISYTTTVKQPFEGSEGSVLVKCLGTAGVESHTIYMDSDTLSLALNDAVQFSIWLKGRGTLSYLALTNDSMTSTIGSVAGIELTDDWQEIKLTRLAQAAMTKVRVTLAIEGQVHATSLYIGPVSLIKPGENATRLEQTPYWNGAGISTVEKVDWSNLGIPIWSESEATVTIMGIWPEQGRYAYFIRATGGDSENALLLASDDVLWNFADKGSGADRTDWYMEIPNIDREGQPFYTQLRAKIGDGSDSLVEMYLKVGDTEYTYTITGEQAYDWVGTANAMGTASKWIACRTLPQQLRIDDRYWSDAESEMHKKMYTSNTYRQLLSQSLGKKYRIADLSYNSLYGSWDTIAGSIILDEVDNIDGMGVGQ